MFLPSSKFLIPDFGVLRHPWECQVLSSVQGWNGLLLLQGWWGILQSHDHLYLKGYQLWVLSFALPFLNFFQVVFAYYWVIWSWVTSFLLFLNTKSFVLELPPPLLGTVHSFLTLSLPLGRPHNASFQVNDVLDLFYSHGGGDQGVFSSRLPAGMRSL